MLLVELLRESFRDFRSFVFLRIKHTLFVRWEAEATEAFIGFAFIAYGLYYFLTTDLEIVSLAWWAELFLGLARFSLYLASAIVAAVLGSWWTRVLELKPPASREIRGKIWERVRRTLDTWGMIKSSSQSPRWRSNLFGVMTCLFLGYLVLGAGLLTNIRYSMPLGTYSLPISIFLFSVAYLWGYLIFRHPTALFLGTSDPLALRTMIHAHGLLWPLRVVTLMDIEKPILRWETGLRFIDDKTPALNENHTFVDFLNLDLLRSPGKDLEWLDSIEWLIRICPIIVVDGGKFSAFLLKEVSTILQSKLDHKTIVVGAEGVTEPGVVKTLREIGDDLGYGPFPSNCRLKVVPYSKLVQTLEEITSSAESMSSWTARKPSEVE